jgi:hypothetical protein
VEVEVVSAGGTSQIARSRRDQSRERNQQDAVGDEKKPETRSDAAHGVEYAHLRHQLQRVGGLRGHR